MFLSYEQVAVSNAVKDVDDLTIPANATGCELQSTGGGIRYTMDDSTAPTTTSGMLLPDSLTPKFFLIEDLRRIKVIRDGATDATLEIHYQAGRDI